MRKGVLPLPDQEFESLNVAAGGRQTGSIGNGHQVVFWYDVILVETSAAPVSEECFPDIHCAVPLYDRHD